jgi:hypothetical protein
MSYKKKISILKTNKTPYVNLDAESGILEVEGVSIPEDADGFYSPIIKWVGSYAKENPKKATIIQLKLIYFNTSTSDYLMSFLREAKQKIENLTIEWHYEEEDDDMRETGQHFEIILETKFIYIACTEIS